MNLLVAIAQICAINVTTATPAVVREVQFRQLSCQVRIEKCVDDAHFKYLMKPIDTTSGYVAKKDDFLSFCVASGYSAQ